MSLTFLCAETFLQWVPPLLTRAAPTSQGSPGQVPACLLPDLGLSIWAVGVQPQRGGGGVRATIYRGLLPLPTACRPGGVLRNGRREAVVGGVGYFPEGLCQDSRLAGRGGLGTEQRGVDGTHQWAVSTG